MSQRDDITFPGLPFGADVRFATRDAFINFDIKLTGPRDNVDEIVAPPQQISGDGSDWNIGVINSPFQVQGPHSSFLFQPKLPPFYVLDDRVLPCLTFFLKAVYALHGLGEQPLEYLEVACVPNGLLLFDGPFYAHTEGLLIPGKDDQSVRESDKRTRVRLYPLATIETGWRCRQIVPQNTAATQWKTQPRPAPASTSRRQKS
ncbi:MAG: BglI family type II restriction endonuclease [Abitibacteriaceae bacterium]|nr:BglI family type II restriction endonuclease [Abditibacteriaceae bacterium]MBV9866175.1 BglI family type II restriction endonuclease [Abditibacteriaceae bacterium]